MLPYRNNRIAGVAIGLFFLAIFGYAYFEAQGILFGPQIQIATPGDAPISVDQQLVHIRGAAKNIVELKMNGNPVSVTEAGVFDESLLLAPGYNRVVLSARDQFGRSTEKTIEIIYSGTTTPPSAHDLINSSTTTNP